jgi:hypothetical protein
MALGSDSEQKEGITTRLGRLLGKMGEWRKNKRGEIEKERWSHAADYSGAGDPRPRDGKL